MPDTFIIYKITNKVTGHIYIGQTSRSVDKRWQEHINTAYTLIGNSRLHAAIRKYGSQNFEHCIIDTCTSRDECNRLEQYYIKKYNTLDRSIGYNTSPGGYQFAVGPNTKEILQIDLTTGDILNIYESITDAAKDMNVAISDISSVLRGINYTCCGYYWCYIEDYNKIDFKELYLNSRVNNQIRVVKLHSITLDVVNIFDSITEAAIDANTSSSAISGVCKGKRHHVGNYTYMYYNDFLTLYDNSFNNKLHLQHLLLRIFPETLLVSYIYISAADAESVHGLCASNICAVINGRCYTAYGYDWCWSDSNYDYVCMNEDIMLKALCTRIYGEV